MSLDQTRCALPGCDEVLLAADDEKMQRKYCCAAHRAAARRLRHEALADLTVAANVPDKGAGVGTLPRAGAKVRAFVQRYQPLISSAPASDTAVRTEAVSLNGQSLNGQESSLNGKASSNGNGAASSNGNGAASSSSPQRPRALHRLPDSGKYAAMARKYSTIAHGHLVTAAAIAKRLAERGRERFLALNRQRRLTAAVVAAALVVSLVWVVVGALTAPSVTQPVAARQQMPVALAPLGGLNEWSDQVNAAEAAVRDRLGKIAGAEQAWNALPPERRGDQPDQVNNLLAMKSSLEHKEMVLNSAVDEISDLRATTSALADAEKRQADVRNTLASLPADQGSAAYQGSVRSQLQGQLDLLSNQCNALRQEHTILENGVRSAMAIPLPNVDESVDGVVGDVMALVQQRNAPPPVPAAVAVNAAAGGGSARAHVATVVHRRAPASAPRVNVQRSSGNWAMNFAGQMMRSFGF